MTVQYGGISPDTVGYGATRQIGRNLTLGARTRSMPQRSDIFPYGRDLSGFEPRILKFQGFPEGRSGCERISPDPLRNGATAGKKTSSRSASLTIAAFNAQSLGTACRRTALIHFIHEHNVDVACC